VRFVGALLLFAAAAGFVRRARQRGDEMLGWLAVGAVLLGTARFHDFLYPSLHTDWLATSDLLRISGQLVLVTAAIGELAAYWHRRAADARDRERRRLAAELHDGLAQELAYLRTHTALAVSEPANSTHLTAISESAKRALEQTRLAIAEWTRGGAASLDALLADLARDVELRYGRYVRLELEPVAVETRVAHELTRVANEAMLNAVRHSGNGTITVRLSTRGGIVRLRVSDDGAGIDARDARVEGFGLIAMRERTERLGGHCRIESAPRRGTVVAVEVPRR
jgi:signal transduction histidine kinase